MTDRDSVLQALNTITDPRSGRGLADAGMVRGLIVSDGRAGFMLEVPQADVAQYAQVRDAAEAVLSG
ncbi:MAG: iron-sulfur cluster assembly protein, partial [Asticcacaulis sp.]